MHSVITTRASRLSTKLLRKPIIGEASSTIRWHGGGSNIDMNAPTIPITFINPHPAVARLMKGGQGENRSNEGNIDKITVDARVGETLLQTAHRHDIDLEGACEGGK